MNTDLTINDVAAKLRSIRNSQNLSLNDVEVLSQGTLKAVVLGSYERGARTLSVKRAIAIAQLYQIPLSQLFGDENPVQLISTGKTVLDLRAINRRALAAPQDEGQRFTLVARVAQRIIRSRQDWNGEVLSIRHNDVETISVLLDQQISETLAWLESENVLLKVRRP